MYQSNALVRVAVDATSPPLEMMGLEPNLTRAKVIGLQTISSLYGRSSIRAYETGNSSRPHGYLIGWFVHLAWTRARSPENYPVA